MKTFENFIQLLENTEYIQDSNSGLIWDSFYLIDEIREKSIEDLHTYIVDREKNLIGCRTKNSETPWNWDSGWKISSESKFNSQNQNF